MCLKFLKQNKFKYYSKSKGNNVMINIIKKNDPLNLYTVSIKTETIGIIISLKDRYTYPIHKEKHIRELIKTFISIYKNIEEICLDIKSSYYILIRDNLYNCKLDDICNSPNGHPIILLSIYSIYRSNIVFYKYVYVYIYKLNKFMNNICKRIIINKLF